jgi:hypothetical protein
MNGRKAKKLRRSVTGDPDLAGRMFCHRRVIASDLKTKAEIVDPVAKTLFNHPHSERAQYQQAKKEERR